MRPGAKPGQEGTDWKPAGQGSSQFPCAAFRILAADWESEENMGAGVCHCSQRFGPSLGLAIATRHSAPESQSMAPAPKPPWRGPP